VKKKISSLRSRSSWLSRHWLKAGKTAGCDGIRLEILSLENKGIFECVKWPGDLEELGWSSHYIGSEIEDDAPITGSLPSSLLKKYREIIEAKLEDTQCSFCPSLALQTKISISSKFLRSLGNMRKMRIFCCPRKWYDPVPRETFWGVCGSSALTTTRHWPSSHCIPAQTCVPAQVASKSFTVGLGLRQGYELPPLI